MLSRVILLKNTFSPFIAIKGEKVFLSRITRDSMGGYNGYEFDDERLPFVVTLYGYYKTRYNGSWKECTYYESQRRFAGIKLWTYEGDGKWVSPNG